MITSCMTDNNFIEKSYFSGLTGKPIFDRVKTIKEAHADLIEGSAMSLHQSARARNQSVSSDGRVH